jgi:hypothetical protein
MADRIRGFIHFALSLISFLSSEPRTSLLPEKAPAASAFLSWGCFPDLRREAPGKRVGAFWKCPLGR